MATPLPLCPYPETGFAEPPRARRRRAIENGGAVLFLALLVGSGLLAFDALHGWALALRLPAALGLALLAGCAAARGLRLLVAALVRASDRRP